MAQYNYQIGLTSTATINVESLTTPVPPPKSIFKLYSQPVDLGNGQVRGAGWSEAEWRWGFLTREQRDQLRTYVGTAASTTIYIRTKTMDSSDSYKYFGGIIIWPIIEEERESKGDRIDFTLRFRKLVEYTP
jgi:hypothetical protein